MKKLFIPLMFLAGVLSSFTASAYNSIWQQVSSVNVPAKGPQIYTPTKFLVYTLDEQYLKNLMSSLSTNPDEGQVVELPLPDGSFRDFKVWQTPMMPEALASKYPSIKTFTAVAVDDQRVTAKLDFTLFGFHAYIIDGDNTTLINPYDNMDDGVYMVDYTRDETKPIGQRMICETKGNDENGPGGQSMQIQQTQLPGLNLERTVSGYQLHTYRLALAADHQYCQAATGATCNVPNTNPTIAQCLSAMTTAMNRINGVYEREFSITMVFVAKEDTLIFPTATGSVNGADPYSADNNNPNNLMSDNQTTCDARIGNANYDIGHVFTTGGGGVTGGAGIVCMTGQKAMCETGGPCPVGDGFTIDFVAHEMGHEYGANHPFNDNMEGSCSGNAVHKKAYEPGSGSTIMAYAGICYPDDLQPHSDPYFHAVNLVEIYNYSIATSGTGSTCAVTSPTNNKPASLASFYATYTIPYKTPFELTGPTAVDSVADTANTYCWEEWNLGYLTQTNPGDFGLSLVNTHIYGPIFRSYNPVYNPTRIFPKDSMVLAGYLSNAGVENNEGEKVPDTTRYLTFRMTVRSILNGYGCFLFPDDSVHIHAMSTGATYNYQGFKVTGPAAGATWQTGSVQSVTWNVVGTNAAPVSCDSVDIYLSGDGGITWATYLGRYVNNGAASITVPFLPTVNNAMARIKVKGAGNIFFNVNGGNFTLGVNNVLPSANDIKLYPVPANNTLYVTVSTNKTYNARVLNSLGQTLWTGEINQKATLDVSKFAKGVYYLQLSDVQTNGRVAKSFVVE